MKMIRVLQYEGDEAFINQHIENRGVKEAFQTRQGKISELFIGFNGAMFGLLGAVAEKHQKEETTE